MKPTIIAQMVLVLADQHRCLSCQHTITQTEAARRAGIRKEGNALPN
jgi:hypothetical protein